MHRATPLMTSFRAYSAGGARATVDKVDDSTLMQEMAGNFLKGESRSAIEAPQNYGFSSVVQAATKGADGQMQECAEAIMSFIGGNRSFPMTGVMDDRRFRPMGLKPGENSQYDDLGQMTLLRRTGLYLLSLDNPDQNQQQQQGKDTSGGSGSSGQSTERFVSIRHVEKQKQQRQQSMAQGGAEAQAMGPVAWAAKQAQIQQSHSDFKHEGDSVNTEVRVAKSKISFYDGATEVGNYDKTKQRWTHYVNGDQTKSMSADKDRVHIRFGNFTVWVDKSGIFSTHPIEIAAYPYD
jgi:phage gp45-like